MADINRLWEQMQERLTLDELEDVFERLYIRYDFTHLLGEKASVKKVIFNPPATIILWTDGTKSVVKCQNGEWYDPEKGFALAYLKKASW